MKKIVAVYFEITTKYYAIGGHYSLNNLFAVCVTLAYRLIFAKYLRISELTMLISHDCVSNKGLFEFNNNISLNIDIVFDI